MMPESHQNTRYTPAQQRPRRGPAFLLSQSSARSNSGSQFASPPRFLLNQQANRLDGSSQLCQNTVVSSPFGGAAAFSRPSHRRPASATQKIDDLTIEDEVSSHSTEDETFSDRDDFFDTARESHKRRRILSPESKSRPRQPSRGVMDEIQDPSSPLSTDSHETSDQMLESPPLSHIGIRHPDVFETPAPTSHKRMTSFQTPVGAVPNRVIQSRANQSSAFHSPPRYIMSVNHTPAAPYASSPATAASTSVPSHGRKKPMFMLPRSPSPDAENSFSETNQPPALFSPTLFKHVHRRGRPASSNTSARYVPGGLAEQLRDWILEKGAEREQATQHQIHNHDESQYNLIAKIDSYHYAYLKSSATVIIAGASQVSTKNKEDQGYTCKIAQDGAQQRQNLLLGASSQYTASKPGPNSIPTFKVGDIIGIRPGLAWEIELDTARKLLREEPQANLKSQARVIASSQSPSESDQDEEVNEPLELGTNKPSLTSIQKPQNTWLVAADWVKLS